MDEIETLVIGVRADTAAFARDVATMRASLDGPLADGAERAGRALEGALMRAVRTGKFGFDDLRRVALSAMAEIAASAVRAGIGAIGGGASSPVAGLATLAGALLGLPGRAGGGPVVAGRGYVVGERGPELFVPTASGRVEAAAAAPRDVRISIAINAPPNAVPEMLARSSRQVARAVRDALVRLD